MSSIKEQKLQQLREEYKTATPSRKRQIEIVAKRIKKSIHLYPEVILSKKEFRIPKQEDELKEKVIDALM